MNPAGATTCPHCGADTRPDARFCRACGRPLTASPSTVDEPEASPPAPPGSTVDAARERRKLLRRLVIGGAVVLVLVAGYLGATAFDRAAHRPDAPVRAFFSALAAKDTTAVRKLTSCRHGPLCDPNALDSGYVPPARLQIREIRFGVTAEDQLARLPKRTTAGVFVRYEVGGTAFDDVLTVHRAGWFGDWSLSSTPGWPLIVDGAQIPRARIAAATVTAGKEHPLGDSPVIGKAWALPGVYTVSFADDPLYIADPVTVTVGGAAKETTIHPVARLRDEVTTEVNRQVRQRVDACAAQATTRPDTDPTLLSGNDCPFAALDRYTITRDITWRITRYPQVALTVGDGRTLGVRTVTEGEAVISYDWTLQILEPRRWTPFSEPITFKVGGQVTTGDDGKVVWTL